MKQESVLRSALSDILKGYSYDKVNKMYIKHLRLDDYVDYEEKYDEYFNGLRRRGVETKDELMERVISKGLWSDKKDLEMEELKKSMEVAKETYDKLALLDQKEAQKKFLTETTYKYNLMYLEKESFVAQSCEVMTNKKLNEYYVINSLFKDPELKIPFISEDEKDDVDFDLSKFIAVYNDLVGVRMNDSNIKKIAISPLFRRSWDVSENAYYYFGKPICELSFLQTTLTEWANEFSYIFKHYPKIKGDDPDKILERARLFQEMNSKGKEDGKTTYVGMSNEEASQMGIKMPDRAKQFEEALKNSKKP